MKRLASQSGFWRCFSVVAAIALAGVLLDPAMLRAAPDLPERVRVANGEWPPWVSVQLPGYGPISRIVEEAFAGAGVEVDWEFLPWNRGLELVRAGQLDATLLWSPTSERERDFLSSSPLMASRWVFFHRRDRVFDWSGFADLAGKTVGVTLGYAYGEAFAAALVAGMFFADTAPTDIDNFRKLARGRIDLFPCELHSGRSLARVALGDDGAAGITSHPRVLRTTTNSLLFSPHGPAAEALRTRFNESLAALIASGRYAAILKEAGFDVDDVLPDRP